MKGTILLSSLILAASESTVIFQLPENLVMIKMKIIQSSENYCLNFHPCLLYNLPGECENGLIKSNTWIL